MIITLSIAAQLELQQTSACMQKDAKAAASALPTPPAPTQVTEAPLAAAAADGHVCAEARIPLLPLAHGATKLALDVPLAGRSTLRGAASRGWRTRPGAYAQAQSRLIGTVRCATFGPPCLCALSAPSTCTCSQSLKSRQAHGKYNTCTTCGLTASQLLLDAAFMFAALAGARCHCQSL